MTVIETSNSGDTMTDLEQRAAEMELDCKICVDGWVCENHPDKSWPSECECGAGMPCKCNPLHKENPNGA